MLEHEWRLSFRKGRGVGLRGLLLRLREAFDGGCVSDWRW
jgi:hypothetical protein